MYKIKQIKNNYLRSELPQFFQCLNYRLNIEML